MRNVGISLLRQSIQTQPMTMLHPRRRRRAASTARAVIVVDHTTDNNLMKFRFANAAVKMQAAEEDFDLGATSSVRARSSYLTRIARRSSRS
jgi:hypothetical protein